MDHCMPPCRKTLWWQSCSLISCSRSEEVMVWEINRSNGGERDKHFWWELLLFCSPKLLGPERARLLHRWTQISEWVRLTALAPWQPLRNPASMRMTNGGRGMCWVCAMAGLRAKFSFRKGLLVSESSWHPGFSSSRISRSRSLRQKVPGRSRLPR